MTTTSRTVRGLIVVAVVASIAPLRAQQANRVAGAVNAMHEQIDRIFSARAYESPRFGPARWMPDGTAYAIVESANGGSEIAKYDAATGARTVLVPASKLVPQGLKTSIDIDDYSWSPDGKRLLIFTNTRRVWRQNTRGDYWVLDTVSGGLKKIGGDAPESSLMFAKFSPDGSRVAYVRGNNIYVEGISDGRREQLTHDGSDTKVNGTSDWVYEEELDLRDAFRWSPDGRRIAYWQFDTTGVGSFQLINNTSGRYPTTTTIQYPKAGTTNSAVRVGVVTVDGGETQWMQAPGDPRENYVARVEWADPTTVAIQQLNRLQNRNDYLLADASRGSVTRAYRDENKAWVDVVDEVRWVNSGKAFLWVSERDGWRHIYRVARGSTSPDGAQLVTNFRADVIDVTGLDEPGGWVYFTASPTNATQQYLYRSKLDGSGTPERVTPADQPGWHTYDLAPGGRLAFHTYSRIDRAPVTDVVDLPAHRSLRALTNPSALTAKLAPIVKVPTEFISVDVGGGVSLDGWMVKPASFDPSRKYPVIAYIYGEVASQTVRDRWGGGTALFNRALADAGYVVVSFDNRGTPAPKGAEWRKVVYGSIGDLSSKEQAAAMRALAAKYSFVDGDHMGIWGWSGGGSNTLNAMFRFPEIYKVGVAIAPMPDQQLYDSIYEERYMGLPKDNAEGYRLGSPINFAEGLKGKLLIIHGTGDDNVHYQGTERLINRLVALGKPFDMMAYPNRTHSIAEGPGTTPHLYHLIARYFTDHLPPNP